MPTDQASEIFLRAIELDPAKREAFVRSESEGLPGILEEVEFLLGGYGSTNGFLEESLVAKLADILPEELGRTSLHPGDQIDDFRIEREVGFGGLGEVYLATQISLDREVALKVTPNWGNEARSMAPLNHENIVQIFSETILEERNLRLIAMQFVAGPNLQQIVESFRAHKDRVTGLDYLSWCSGQILRPTTVATGSEFEFFRRSSHTQVVLWIGVCLADALTCAHRRGVLHLDIKPANVLLTAKGKPLLADFNVSSRRTEEGVEPRIRGGTPEFMAPEQSASLRDPASEESVDFRADIYSLGVLLQKLFEARGTHPSSPRGGSFEPQLVQALNRATRSDRSARFSTMEEFRQSLENCLIRSWWELPLRVPDWVVDSGLVLLGALPGIFSYFSLYSHFGDREGSFFFQMAGTIPPVLAWVGGALAGSLCVLVRGRDPGARTASLVRQIPWIYGGIVPLGVAGVAYCLIQAFLLGEAIDLPPVFLSHFRGFFFSVVLVASVSCLSVHFLVFRTILPRLLGGNTSADQAVVDLKTLGSRTLKMNLSVCLLAAICALALGLGWWDRPYLALGRLVAFAGLTWAGVTYGVHRLARHCVHTVKAAIFQARTPSP